MRSLRNFHFHTVGAAITALTLAGCSAQTTYQDLPACWNVNTLSPGNYRGSGIFTTSMDGLSLSAPACADTEGMNRFELGPAADRSAGAIGHERFYSFRFEGTVMHSAPGNKIRFDRIWQIEKTMKPSWRIELERKLGISVPD